jgi:hypothetical protein
VLVVSSEPLGIIRVSWPAVVFVPTLPAIMGGVVLMLEFTVWRLIGQFGLWGAIVLAWLYWQHYI